MTELEMMHAMLDSLRVPRAIVADEQDAPSPVTDRFLWFIYRSVESDTLERLERDNARGEAAADHLKKLSAACEARGVFEKGQTPPWAAMRWAKENL